MTDVNLLVTCIFFFWRYLVVCRRNSLAPRLSVVLLFSLLFCRRTCRGASIHPGHGHVLCSHHVLCSYDPIRTSLFASLLYIAHTSLSPLFCFMKLRGRESGWMLSLSTIVVRALCVSAVACPSIISIAYCCVCFACLVFPCSSSNHP